MKRSAFTIICLLILVCVGFASMKVVAPSAAWQGNVAVIKLVSAEGVHEASGLFLKKTFNFYRDGADWRGIIGIPLEQAPGTYPLKISVKNENNREQIIKRKIAVKGIKYPAMSFKLKPAKKILLEPDIVQADWGKIEKVLIVEEQKQGWQGKFILPVDGPISMLFGSREFVNGQKRGQHRGIDLAVVTGTTVEAANGGQVVFAGNLKVFGGTIVIDHGQGIQTLYFHLSKLLTKTGDQVAKGEPIALSGDTGSSSGPHLHWGMSVHNLRVDPLQWVKNEI